MRVSIIFEQGFQIRLPFLLNRCPKNFAGLYCEISLDEVNWKQLISSSLKVHHEYLLTDQQQGSGGVATTTIIVLIVLVCFGLATVYAVRRVDFSSRFEFSKVFSNRLLEESFAY